MNKRMFAQGLWLYVAVVVGWIAYAALTLQAPTANAQKLYHVTPAQIVALDLTFIVPLLAIWLFAAYGTAWIKYYTNLLHGAAEARGFRNLADGIFILFIGLVTQSLVGTARSYYQDTSAIRAIVIENNYLQIIFPLAAFLLLYMGSRRLLRFTTEKPPMFGKSVSMLTVAAVSALYLWLTLHNPNRTLPVSTATPATFYLSDSMIIGTIIVPYILTWLLGVLACYNLYWFSKRSKGVIYREALRRLVIGLIGVLTLSAVIQLIGTAGIQIAAWSLGQVLMLIYALVALMAVGYLYIAMGASRLARIEEV